MMRIVVSGHKGFIVGHLIRNISLFFPQFDIITLEKNDFISKYFNGKIKKDDIIYHLAGVNKAISDKDVYDQNKKLNLELLNHLIEINFLGTLFFSSSLQEDKNTFYGKAKKEARVKFEEASKKHKFKFYFLKIPNVFGPFCRPNYNSFIATFSDKLIKREMPKIIEDNKVLLIYIDDLINSILLLLRGQSPVLHTEVLLEIKVSEVLKKLFSFKEDYIEKNEFPKLNTSFDINLFNTFRSYIDLKAYYPKKHQLHSDYRGFFSELSRSGSKCQSSFSSTNSKITRGNHFHIRKVERFSVIKGEARIQLRKYLTDDVISFELDGKNPSFIDMPVWYTHNITNLGNDELITFFWINEPYNENDTDTYIENV